MVEYVPFLFDNFVADDNPPILDLSINHHENADDTDKENYSTPEILDKIRNKLMGIVDNG